MKPYLLILMRNDMDTMTGGRAAAQASHATSLFTVRAELAMSSPLTEDKEVKDRIMDPPGQTYVDWRCATPQFFGTAIVVGVSERELLSYVAMAQECGYQAEIVSDPTYGVKDGRTIHFLPVNTCGYVFVNRDGNLFYDFTKTLPLF